MALETITPAKAKHIPHEDYSLLWGDDKFINSNFVAEEKFDGSRYILYLDQGGHKLLSRRISDVTNEFVDKTENCPHLTKVKLPSELLGTILDGELVHPNSQKSDLTTSIMGCLPEKAIARQKEQGYLQYRIYDIPFFAGVDLRSKPLHTRREYLKDAFDLYKKYIPLILTEQVTHTGFKSLYEKVLKNKGEGIMLKDINAPYGKGWFKVKKVITWDVIITGFEDPKKESVKVTGKVSTTKFYEKGWIGAIKFGLIKDKKIVELGTCSGFPDDLREEISKNKSKYLKTVMEISCQERTAKGNFRHPRFLKLRSDKSYKQCVDGEF